jgi:hypothetical protein
MNTILTKAGMYTSPEAISDVPVIEILNLKKSFGNQEV